MKPLPKALLDRLIAPERVQSLVLFSSTVLATALLLFVLVDTVALGSLVIVCCGVAWATTSCVPWYIVSTACAGQRNVGTYTGFFNSSQCFPEIVISLIGAVLLPLTDDDYGCLFVVGSMAAAANLYFATQLIVVDDSGPDSGRQEITQEFEAGAARDAHGGAAGAEGAAPL